MEGWGTERVGRKGELSCELSNMDFTVVKSICQLLNTFLTTENSDHWFSTQISYYSTELYAFQETETETKYRMLLGELKKYHVDS